MRTTPTTTSTRLMLATAIMAAFTLSLGTTTSTADDFGVPKASIRYSDLNLATVQGAKLLYERIISASYEVCQSFGRDDRDQPDPLALEDCRKKIVAEAVGKIGKPPLYAEYRRRNGQRASIVTADGRK